jgi:hypothetical protein
MRPLADSTSRCDGGGCTGSGDDDDYAFVADSVCTTADRNHKNPLGGSTPIPFAQLPLSNLTWQSTGVPSAGPFSSGQNFCKNSDWSGQAGQVTLPSASALVELLDFGQPGLVPMGLDSAGGPYWAGTKVSNTALAWQVNFSTGAFKLADTSILVSGPTGSARCVDVANNGSAPPPAVSFPCSAGPSAGQTCEVVTAASSASTTRLKYFLPTVAVGSLWAGAQDYCNTLDGACGTWRLPSYKELAALVNFTSVPTGSTELDGLQGGYWSSTPSPVVSGAAMVITFSQVTSQGSTPGTFGTADSEGANHRVICVSGPP